MALSFMRPTERGINIGSEIIEKIEDIERWQRDAELREQTLIGRIDAQARVIDSLRELVRELVKTGVIEPARASRVEQARNDPAKKARTIYVALSDEMGGTPSDRTLVSMVSRIDAEYHAQFEARGLLGPQENPTTSHALALYLSAPVEGPNQWRSPVTRRIHKVLDHLGIKPSQRERA